jgi:hypothetical protein
MSSDLLSDRSLTPDPAKTSDAAALAPNGDTSLERWVTVLLRLHPQLPNASFGNRGACLSSLF